MRSRDDWNELARVLEREGELLESLVAGMKERRMAYVAARPSKLEQATTELESLRDTADACERERASIVRRLASAIGVAADTTLSDLLARAPMHVNRARIQHAADRTARAAKAAQVESRVGARLLEFARTCQDALIHDLCGLVKDSAPSGYDRNARTIGAARSSGNLVSGTV